MSVDCGALGSKGRSRMVPVHRYGDSKHWNIDAEVSASSVGVGVWRSKHMRVEIDSLWKNATIVVDAEANAENRRLASEAVFHACRGLAVYCRAGADGNFLHASGVDFEGRSILFFGPKMSGKTTFLLEAITKHGGVPLTNDRAYIPAGAQPPIVYSWPSYVTLFEGTIFNYPQLIRAAKSYSSDSSCSYRGEWWPGTVERSFAPEKKRAYPMPWLTCALDIRYVWSSALRAFVLGEISASAPRSSMDEIDVGDRVQRDLVRSALLAESFDHREPAFLPWHGRALPMGAPEIDEVIERVKRSGGRFFRMTLRASDVDELGPMLTKMRAGLQLSA